MYNKQGLQNHEQMKKNLHFKEKIAQLEKKLYTVW